MSIKPFCALLSRSKNDGARFPGCSSKKHKSSSQVEFIKSTACSRVVVIGVALQALQSIIFQSTSQINA